MRSIHGFDCGPHDHSHRAHPQLSRRAHRRAARYPRAPGAVVPGGPHFDAGGGKARRLGHRGASRAGEDRRRRRHSRQEETQRPRHRLARRHGLPADAREEQLRAQIAARRAHACLRPRWPHHHAARRRALPRRDAQLRRHGVPDLPARRGRRRRRRGDGEGRAVQALPRQRGLRAAQLARAAARQDGGARRTGDRRERRSDLCARLSGNGEQRSRCRVRRAGWQADVRRRERHHRARAHHGRRGFLLHAAGASRRLRVPRPGRRPGGLPAAQSELRFQRRGDSARRWLSSSAGGGSLAAQIGGIMKALLLMLALIAAPVHAVTLKWAAQNDVLTLDPHSQNHATTHAVLQYTYEGLVRYTKDYKIEPSLAVKWEEVSPTQWRFMLRKNVKFHDGSPFTADDVVFSFGRIKQPQGTNQIYVSGIKEVKKIDDYTVDLLLDGPSPILLRNIVDFRIMSKSCSEKNRSQNIQDYKAKEETYASRNTNGTGPYIIKAWEPDKRIVFALNKDWWGKLDGNVTDVVYTPIKSDATRVSALLSGDVDLVTD